jgi:hypothetical protein
MCSIPLRLKILPGAKLQLIGPLCKFQSKKGFVNTTLSLKLMNGPNKIPAYWTLLVSNEENDML